MNRTSFLIYSTILGSTILGLSLSILAPTARAETVIHTVYAASALSRGGLQVEWKKGPEGWESGTSARHYEFVGECSTLLAHQQMFALREMAKRGVITEAQVKEYGELGLNLTPRQVSFFEHAFGRQTKATLWSVSGQDYEGRIRERILPWMLETKWKHLAAEVDRKKYPLLWEWGRAAQVDTGDINALLDFATQKAYREVKTLGGRIEDAYIMLHAISPAHTLSYLKRFPGTQFSKNSVRDGDSILMIPLTQILKIHSLEKSSRLIRDLKGIMDDVHFTDDRVVDLIESFREKLWFEADWKGVHGPSPFPIIIHDFSPWGVNSVLAKLKSAGIPKRRSEAAIDRLLAMPMTKRIRKAHRYIDASEPQGAGRLSFEANAIEVTGLDPSELAQDPLYLYRVLFSVATATMKQVREIMGVAKADDIWRQLIEFQTPIAIATRNSQISAAVRKLRPDSTRKWITDSADNAPKETRDALGDDWGSQTDVHFFTFGRLLQMVMEDPSLEPVFNSATSRLIRGEQQIHYNLMNPDLY